MIFDVNHTTQDFSWTWNFVLDSTMIGVKIRRIFIKYTLNTIKPTSEYSLGSATYESHFYMISQTPIYRLWEPSHPPTFNVTSWYSNLQGLLKASMWEIANYKHLVKDLDPQNTSYKISSGQLKQKLFKHNKI